MHELTGKSITVLTTHDQLQLYNILVHVLKAWCVQETSLPEVSERQKVSRMPLLKRIRLPFENFRISIISATNNFSAKHFKKLKKNLQKLPS